MGKLKVYQKQYNFCKPYIKNFHTALDIGCEVLDWSKCLSQDFQLVQSFDFRDMGTDLSQYPNIKFYKTGLGDEETVKYTKPGVGRIKGDNKPQGTSTMAVKITTIDSFKFDNVDFIKLDCDGYEEKVLQGSAETIEKFSPVIFCEYNPDRCQSHEWLLAKNYHLQDVFKIRDAIHDGLYIRK